MAKADGSGINKRRAYIYHYLLNIVVAGIFSYYIWGSLNYWKSSRNFLAIVLLIRCSTVVFLFLIRRPSTTISRRPDEWFIAVAGTLLSHLFTCKNAGPILPALVPYVYIQLVAACLLAVAALFSLGRSFGIVPANRGIKTHGLYGLVRHPIYLCYILFDSGVVLRCSSIRNCGVFILHILIFYIRAKQEEKILRQDPAYESYAQRIRYMFLPGIL